MRTITITTYASMPWRFRVEHVENKGRPFGRDASAPEKQQLSLSTTQPVAARMSS